MASLPVLMHPKISEKTPRESILKRMSLVLGSSACSTVARSSLSFVRLRSFPRLRSDSRIALFTRWGTEAPEPPNRSDAASRTIPPVRIFLSSAGPWRLRRSAFAAAREPRGGPRSPPRGRTPRTRGASERPRRLSWFPAPPFALGRQAACVASPPP